MKRVLFLALFLGACSSLNTPHANLERGEIIGETAFATAVDTLNMAAAQGKITGATRDSLSLKAWHDLQNFRRLYNTGQVTTDALKLLQNDGKVS